MKNTNPTFATLPKDSILESTDKPLSASVGIFMEEIWKDIEGYKDYYQISNLGRVKALKRRIIKSNNYRNTKERILKINKSSNGYLTISLSMFCNGKTFRIHRLISVAFIDNPENKPCINHIDGNKFNNTIENLEWCTYSENAIHAYKNGLRIPSALGKLGINNKGSKLVYQYDLEGNYINQYNGTQEAHRMTGVHQGNIAACARGKYSHAGGFIWKYK